MAARSVLVTWGILASLACCSWAAAAASADSGDSTTTNGTCMMQMVNRVAKQPLRGASLLMSEVQSSSGAACAGGHCVVPAGQTWIMDTSMDVETFTVQGTLEWDTTKAGLELRAGFIIVEDGGHLKVGTKASPMELKATIYLKKGYTHHTLGTRVLGGVGNAKLDIHGRLLPRTWTLLSKTAFAGSTQLFVKDDPELMGWRAGDRIGLATTSRGRSSVYTIDSIGAPLPEPPSCPAMADVKKTCSTTQCKVLATNMYDKTCKEYCAQNGLTCKAAWEEVSNDCNELAVLRCDEAWPGTSDLLCECNAPPTAPHQLSGASGVKVLHLKEPLQDEHWGGFRTVGGRRLEMAAEVVNLERSVLITGDHDDFYITNQGLHTIMTGTGYIDVRYARVEYCGQRDLMGRYCLHFHRMMKCPLCVFEGNAVVDSAQVGITVHGTHNSLVSNNVVWDARAVGIYTEDGNEMNNVIKQNVIICSWWQTCSVNWLQNIGLHAGIFLIGMTNDLIENRVAGHENCIWTPGGARGDGHGAALGKVCPMYTPFGQIRGNVNHDCQRFGLYLDNQFPRNVKRDDDGFVTDFASCQKFTVDGEDNGLVPANVVRDEFDWHNMFVGQYNMGDVQFMNYTGVNNHHSMYWKSSKNFADGGMWHVLDSFIANDPSDNIGQLQFLGPGGPHVFGIKNTVFAGGPTGCGAICAGQHCGLGIAGGPCISQYLLEGVDFSGVDAGGQLIEFGVHCTDPGKVLPVFLAKDGSLGGARSMVSRHLDGFGKIAGCKRMGPEWSHAFGCSAPIRRMNVWGPDSGDLTLSGPGYAVESNWMAPVVNMNAGRMLYEPLNGKGYGVPVLVGESYALSGFWRGDMVLDFSDSLLTSYFGVADESVTVEVGGAKCQIRASHDRRFLSPKGPVPRILPTHARIEGGKILCGGSDGGAPVKPPSKCSLLRDVRDTCSPDGCKVLTGGMRNKACSSYCASTGLFCTGAWQPVGDGCAAVLDVVVGCEEVWLSDLSICECGPEPAPPSTTMKSTTTTLLPPGTTLSTLPPSGTKSPQTPQCSALPDVKAVCSADGCKVLAGSMTGLTCAEYCARSGMECAGAWEEMSDDCAVKATMTCDQVWPDTSDLLCECAVTAPTTTAPVGGTTLPGVQQPEPPARTYECNLPDVKDFCSSSGCKVLAGGMLGKTCEDYCGQSKLFCLGAWEEFDDTCTEEQALPCNETLARGTTDLICECGAESTARKVLQAEKQDGTQALPPSRTVGVPSPSATPPPSPCRSLPDVKNICSADGCKVLAGGMTGKTCAEYCARSNLQCARAWEEQNDDCQVKAAIRCDEVWPGTSDLLCECTDAAVAPAPAPAPSSGAAAAWEHHQGYNCFSGRGGVGVAQKDPLPGKFLLEGCQRECEADAECVAVVMVRQLVLDRNPYTCWLKRSITLGDCVQHSVYDLWKRLPASHGAASPAPAPAPAPAPLQQQPEPQAPAGWQHRQGYNCFEGRGGAALAGKSPLPGKYLLEDCQKQCEADVDCVAVIMVRQLVLDRNPYLCWMKKAVTPGDCLQNTAYDLWQRGPGSHTAAGHAAAILAPANDYRHSSGVGGWGGWCTCPDGQRYNVGDLNDGCAQGPKSLACFGGVPGECVKNEETARKGMMVTCAAVAVSA